MGSVCLMLIKMSAEGLGRFRMLTEELGGTVRVAEGDEVGVVVPRTSLGC